MIPEIDSFIEVVVDGDNSLMLDAQSLLHYKSSRLTWKDSSTLQAVYRKTSELSLAKVVGKATVLVYATALKSMNSPYFVRA